MQTVVRGRGREPGTVKETRTSLGFDLDSWEARVIRTPLHDFEIGGQEASASQSTWPRRDADHQRKSVVCAEGPMLPTPRRNKKEA